MQASPVADDCVFAQLKKLFVSELKSTLNTPELPGKQAGQIMSCKNPFLLSGGVPAGLGTCFFTAAFFKA